MKIRAAIVSLTLVIFGCGTPGETADAGVVGADAGTAQGDAGGAGVDSGVLRVDAGEAPVDAGVISVFDAGALPMLPGSPLTLQTSAGRRQVNLSWLAPASDGNSEITSYVVTTLLAGAEVGALTVTAPTMEAVIGELVNGTGYAFSVTATNAVGMGPPATSGLVTPKGVSDPPTAVAAVADIRSATVTWVAPADTGGDPVTTYVVTPSMGSAITVAGTVTSAHFDSLLDGTSYTFVVTAINASGTSANSVASTSVTTRGLPGAPTSVIAVRDTAQIVLTWLAPADTSGEALTGFVVTPYIGTVAQAPFSVNGGSTTSTFIFAGLTPGTTYTYVVAAVSAVGTGAASIASQPVTTATVPTAPLALTAQVYPGALTVNWAEPSTNGGIPINTYIASIPDLSMSVSTNSVTFSVTLSPLAGGRSYDVQVVAINTYGASPPAMIRVDVP